MPDQNHYSVLLIVDRSASILPFRGPMVRGLREVVAGQAGESGLVTMSVVEFDSEIEVTHILESPERVDFTLRPRGRTALYDAIGLAILHLRDAISDLPEHARPGGVQVVLITDGRENSSTEFSLAEVRRLVRHQREKHGWRFMFLGANQDAQASGAHLGFGDENIAFEPDSEGVTLMTQTIARSISVRSASSSIEL